MKRIFIAMLAIVGVLFATSCSDDEVTPMLTLSKKMVTFTSDGGMESIDVTSNVDWKVESPDWIQVKKEEKKIVLTVAPNKTLEALTGEMKVMAGDLVEKIKVTQAALVGEATITPESLELQSDKGTVTVKVVANIDTWTAKADVDWLTLTAKPKDKQLLVAYTKNASPEVRNGVITVTVGKTKKTINVKQAELVGEATITPENLELESKAGETTVKVVANYDNWTAKTDADWLTVTAKPKDNQLVVAYTENANTEERNSTITITVGKTEKTINVKQAELVGEATITPENLELESKAGETTVKVVANYDNWTAKTDADWLTLTAKPENEELMVKYTENKDKEERNAVITITVGKTEKTINVKQAAAASDELTFIMPYVDFTKNINFEQVDKFEKERGSTTEGYKNGSVNYDTKSKIFPKATYFFSGVNLDTAYTLTTPEIMKKNKADFIAFLQEKGFKAVAGSTTIFKNEKIATKANIVIQANIAGVVYTKMK